MKGSRPGLYHYRGCFPLDIFQFVNVHKIWPPKLKLPFPKWPDQHKRFITCVDPSLAFFKIKLFSLNVKQVQNIKNYKGTLVYPQPILQRKTKLLIPLKLLLTLPYPLPHPLLTGNNSPKFCVYTCLLKNSLITCLYPWTTYYLVCSNLWTSYKWNQTIYDLFATCFFHSTLCWCLNQLCIHFSKLGKGPTGTGVGWGWLFPGSIHSDGVEPMLYWLFILFSITPVLQYSTV